jgi:hypothetical protein
LRLAQMAARGTAPYSEPEIEIEGNNAGEEP